MDDLLVAQARLQAEADEVVRALDLVDQLHGLGEPTRVGSSALGLMVRRDIDITVSCPRLDAATLAAFAQLGARLMQRTDLVVGVRFRNDAGSWNAEPQNYPDGLHLGLTVRTAASANWTFDIWLVDQPERQPDLKHLRTLLPRLQADTNESVRQALQAVGPLLQPAVAAAALEVLIETSSMPSSAKKKFRDATRQKPQQPDPMQQQAAMLQQQAAMLELQGKALGNRKTEAETMKLMAEAQDIGAERQAEDLEQRIDAVERQDELLSRREEQDARRVNRQLELAGRALQLQAAEVRARDD